MDQFPFPILEFHILEADFLYIGLTLSRLLLVFLLFICFYSCSPSICRHENDLTATT